MTSRTELVELAERVVARAAAGEQVECIAIRGRTTSVKAYRGEIESLTSAEPSGVGIRVVTGNRQGFAYAGSLDADVVLETLAEARDNTAFGEPDEWNGLAEPDGVEPVAVQLWHDELADFPAAAKVDLALALERVTIGRDPRVRGVRTATYADSLGEAAVVTSTGIRTWGRATSCHLSVSALAEDGGETQIGGGVSVGRKPSELDVDEAASDAIERATRMLGAKKAPSQRLTVVLEPRMAATVIGIAAGMLTGDAVLKGRSPFADRVGDAIASPRLTFVDDPTDPRSLGADEFDGEGLACRRNPLVDGGVLQGFLHNCYTGRRSGTASTASAVRGYRSTPMVGVQALAIAPGAGSHDDLVSRVDDGLLVTSMTGLHSGVNPVSGDFSVGVDGLRIRGGTLAEPIREVTIASTVQRLLLDIAEVGADLEWLPSGAGAVTLVIPDVSLSGS
jgi:PmbA protein